jgi:hypothetical protein
LLAVFILTYTVASQPTGISVLAFAAAPVMGDGAPAEGDAPTEDDRDEADEKIKISFGVAQRRHPTKIEIAACILL